MDQLTSRLRRLLAKPNRERGEMDMTAEAAVIAGGIIMLILVIVAGGRMASADITVNSAASSAAREVSLMRSAAGAQTTGQQAATAALTSQGINCTSLDVDVDPAGLNAPIGQIGMVRVTVSCVVPLADLTVPGMPSSKTITATATNPVDPYRERS